LKIRQHRHDGQINLGFDACGSTRGKLPGIPPPVMCASAETHPFASIVRNAGA